MLSKPRPPRPRKSRSRAPRGSYSIRRAIHFWSPISVCGVRRNGRITAQDAPGRVFKVRGGIGSEVAPHLTQRRRTGRWLLTREASLSHAVNWLLFRQHEVDHFHRGRLLPGSVRTTWQLFGKRIEADQHSAVAQRNTDGCAKSITYWFGFRRDTGRF